MDSRTVSVNPETGELSFQLNGRRHAMKVTWRAISDIQKDLGYGIVPLAVKFQARQFGLSELATVVWRGLLAANPTPAPSYEQAAEEVFKEGILSPPLIEAVTKFCELALTGGKAPDEDNGDRPGKTSAAEKKANSSPSAA